MSQMKTIDLFVKELIRIVDGHIKFGEAPENLVELIDFMGALRASERDICDGTYATILKEMHELMHPDPVLRKVPTDGDRSLYLLKGGKYEK